MRRREVVRSGRPLGTAEGACGPDPAQSAESADTVGDSAQGGVKGRVDRVLRPTGTVYHFLLPDPGLADYRDKAAKALEPANMKRIREWRKDFCKPFTVEQIVELEALSNRVDELWAAHTEQLSRDHRETEDTLSVWGQSDPVRERRTANTWKDRIRAQGSFQRGHPHSEPLPAPEASDWTTGARSGSGRSRPPTGSRTVTNS